MFVIDERVQGLIEKAERLGVHLKFDAGLMLVHCEAGDREAQESILAELAKFPEHVRSTLEARAIRERARAFYGCATFVHGYGSGTLQDGAERGVLQVQMDSTGRDGGGRKICIGVPAADAFIFVAEGFGDENASPSSDASPKPEKRGGILDFLRRTPKDASVGSEG